MTEEQQEANRLKILEEACAHAGISFALYNAMDAAFAAECIRMNEEFTESLRQTIRLTILRRRDFGGSPYMNARNRRKNLRKKK